MENKPNQVVNHGIIAEFISASSTQAVKKTTRVEDPETSSGIICFTTTRGFTLIELLVVVLIIGILAAVAVPQYQKAVEKSRATQAMALLKAMVPAAEAYFLTHGSFPETFEEFDFELPADWTGHEMFAERNILDARSNKEWSALLDSANSNWYALHVGKWNGDYKGAGFSYYITSATPEIPRGQLLCTEMNEDITDGIPFEKEDGAFCEKLFHGSLSITTGNQRFYKLP